MLPFTGLESTPFVCTGWEMFLQRSPSLLWPQSIRIEMLMWHYEWEVRTVQPFVDKRPSGLIELCAYSIANAISGCSHSQHSEIAQALVSLLFMCSFERQLDILIMSWKCIPHTMPVTAQTHKTSHLYINKLGLKIKQFREEWPFTEQETTVCVLQITRESLQIILS
jgi:hypothetical protein